MQIGLGPRTAPEDIVELLLACHERIRRFSALACALAEAEDLDEAEVAQAATAVVRYFAEALPLHVRDEEESVLPRLKGASAELDAALDRMHGEHEKHEPGLERLLQLCSELGRTPERQAELASELRACARELESAFEAHLAEEERVVLPAVRALPPAVRDKMLRELRARRGAS
jgi:iron-sulfur cluster repair protein YtfE (RIC family)